MRSVLVLVVVIASCFIGCSDGKSSEPSPAGNGGESGDGSGGTSGEGGASGAAGMAGAGGEGGASGAAGMAGEGGASGAAGMAGEGGEGGASGSAGMAGAGGQGGEGGQGGDGGGGGTGCDGDAEVGDSVQRVRYAEAQVEPGAECESETQARTCTVDGWTDWTGTFTEVTCVVGPDEGCDGMTENRSRYEAAQVAYGEECTSEAQTRSCTGETWGAWSGTFTHEACTVAAAADCEGAEHGEDASRVRYLTESVPYGQVCTSEMQTAPCDDGELGAWSGTYTFESCVVAPGLPCGDLMSGGQNMRMRYATATVPFGQTCTAQAQTQTCTNGVLGDWTGTSTFEACTVDAPADCMDGMHGDTRMRTRYQASTVSWGASCVSEQQTETCSNGTWLPWTGTYTFESCAVSDPIDCAGGTHGGSEMRTRYATANVPNGNTCQSEVQTRFCTNGVWGDWSGTYTQAACTVLPPFAGSCTLINLGTPLLCTEWIGSAVTTTSAMNACTASQGTYSAGHCSASNQLGVCKLGAGTVAEYDTYYYAGNILNAAQAQQACTSGNGAWTAAQ